MGWGGSTRMAEAARAQRIPMEAKMTSPEREFLVWFSTRQFMIVRKHRDEVRAHLMKALRSEEVK
jgi:hypothetical protein